MSFSPTSSSLGKRSLCPLRQCLTSPPRGLPKLLGDSLTKAEVPMLRKPEPHPTTAAQPIQPPAIPCDCDTDPIEGLKKLFVDYAQGVALSRGRVPATRRSSCASTGSRTGHLRSCRTFLTSSASESSARRPSIRCGSGSPATAAVRSPEAVTRSTGTEVRGDPASAGG
jgi:hypothetical protein